MTVPLPEELDAQVAPNAASGFFEFFCHCSASEAVGGLTMLCSANVKEGTSITIYGEGDENFTRTEIGVPKKKTLL